MSDQVRNPKYRFSHKEAHKVPVLLQIMVGFGNRVTQGEVNDMVKQADKNGDGVIDYEGCLHILLVLIFCLTSLLRSLSFR